MIDIENQKELEEHETRVCKHLAKFIKFDVDLSKMRFNLGPELAFMFVSSEYWWPIDKLDQAKKVLSEYKKTLPRGLNLDHLKTAREISYYVFNQTYLKQCQFYKKYKGLKRPKCNNGLGCDRCWNKYLEQKARRS